MECLPWWMWRFGVLSLVNFDISYFIMHSLEGLHHFSLALEAEDNFCYIIMHFFAF